VTGNKQRGKSNKMNFFREEHKGINILWLLQILMTVASIYYQ